MNSNLKKLPLFQTGSSQTSDNAVVIEYMIKGFVGGHMLWLLYRRSTFGALDNTRPQNDFFILLPLIQMLLFAKVLRI